MNNSENKRSHIETMFINKYKGKSRSYISFAPKTVLFISNFVINPLILLIEFFIIIWTIVYLRIRVSSNGVKYRNKFFRWDEIKTIGIAVTKHKAPHKFYYKMILISKHKHEKPVHLFHYKTAVNYRDYKDVQRITVAEGIPSYLIIASFNRRLLRHIIAYWGTDIKNLEDTAGWHSYLRFYNFIYRRKRIKSQGDQLT